MKTGRKRVPTALNVLRGNPSRRPLPEHEAQPAAKAPKCPEQLDDEARREWRRITRELLPLGLLTPPDRAALAGYCQSWSQWVGALEKVKQLGAVVKSPTGYPIQNPYLSIANQALKSMRQFLVEFGMTPQSRSGVTATAPAAKADPFDTLIRGNRKEA